MYGLFTLRSRDVQHPTSRVYHVPSQVVLTSLPQSGVDRKVKLTKVEAYLEWPCGINLQSGGTRFSL